MDYYQYSIVIAEKMREVLLAFLSELPLVTFEETEEEILVYWPYNVEEEVIETYLKDLQQQFSFQYTKTLVPHRNWNEVWESNFQPITVNGFCGIRADFHAPMKEVKYEIVINPKMAFGTGHHETTFLMMEQMRQEVFSNKKVLDYGCGTGILAILAAKLGATTIDAVDIENQSYLNTMENAQMNNVDSIQSIQGTLKAVLDTGYDIILANINRNVILSSLSSLYEKLNKRGTLLVSGILHTDLDRIKQEGQSTGFTIDEVRQKGEWMMIRMLK